MPETEEQRRLRQADQAAGTMFNVFPQGTGAAINRAISPAVQGITNAFTNFTSGPLIRTGGQRQEPATPTTRTLPSGTPIGGFDTYPTSPQMPPSAPTPFPYGSALGPSIYTQTPTQTNLRTGMGGGIPAFPSNFSNINPQPTAPLIPFRGGGTAVMGLGGANVEYPSRLTLSGGAYGPREMGARDFGAVGLPQPQRQEMLRQYTDNPFTTPAQRFAPTLTQGLTQLPITTSLPIEQGPLSANINAPRSAEAQGRQAIQTPYGTIYATAEQAANMQTPRTMAQSSSRTPEQQQALLAQMRERGAGIKQRIAQGQQEFDQKSIQRGYAFRQGLAETAAQRALTPAFGREPTSSAKARGAQALAEAERWRQAQSGRGPMSREPLVMGANAPQPAVPSFPRPSTGGPSTMGIGGSPFSLTPFAQTMEQPEPPPLARFTAAINPSTINRRFRRLPFGMRRFGVI